MYLLRLIIIAAVLWFAMRMVRRVMRGIAARKTTELGYRGKMVACVVCGVYLPEHDAVRDADGKFRCDKH
jgi:hypothetical protein